MIQLSVKSTYFFSVLICLFVLTSCKEKPTEKETHEIAQVATTQEKEIIVGANNFKAYLPLLKGKNIAIVANQTSMVHISDSVTEDGYDLSLTDVPYHLVDFLNDDKNITVKKVFAPEHGFRGKADAGEHIEDGKDAKTGLPIFSLHGKNKKPSPEQLKDVDIVIFDIQDVGVRFYTYIATLQYVMEGCAEANIPVIVLDRPNPNAHYIDGPTLESEHKSFLGLNEIPLVYGMTIGEYAKMVNGEKWLKNGIQCDLTVIPLQNYTHDSEYSLPIRPSPNLPNDKAINLYPSLGFFEGTPINAGRGSEMQFQIYGASFFKKTDFSYTPKPNFGSKNPKHKDKLCNGVDLRNHEKLSKVDLKWVIDAYNKTPKTKKFFGPTFTAHAGNTKLRVQIEKGLSADEIRKSWQDDLEKFKKVRAKYLIYE